MKVRFHSDRIPNHPWWCGVNLLFILDQAGPANLSSIVLTLIAFPSSRQGPGGLQQQRSEEPGKRHKPGRQDRRHCRLSRYVSLEAILHAGHEVVLTPTRARHHVLCVEGPVEIKGNTQAPTRVSPNVVSRTLKSFNALKKLPRETSVHSWSAPCRKSEP